MPCDFALNRDALRRVHCNCSCGTLRVRRLNLRRALVRECPDSVGLPRQRECDFTLARQTRIACIFNKNDGIADQIHKNPAPNGLFEAMNDNRLFGQISYKVDARFICGVLPQILTQVWRSSHANQRASSSTLNRLARCSKRDAFEMSASPDGSNRRTSWSDDIQHFSRLIFGLINESPTRSQRPSGIFDLMRRTSVQIVVPSMAV